MNHLAVRISNWWLSQPASASASASVTKGNLLRPWQWVSLLAVVSIVLRFVAIGLVPLIPEEAYYWMYAQHPSLSYFDHPPMVAWVIRMGTFVFGDTEFGVRLVGNLLMCASVGLMYEYARLFTSRRCAIGSALLLVILPVYQWAGFINTMNSQLVFCWLLAMYGSVLALRRGVTAGWYLAGVGFGGAMLSKYTGIFVGGGLLLALLIHRPWRGHLRSPHPYLGALLGIVMFGPVLLWNYRNGWASFRFQFLDRTESHPLLSPAAITSSLNFVGRQMVVVTPLFLFCCWSLLRRARRPMVTFALCMSLPMLAAMAWKSLTFDVHLDWTVAAYLALFPPVARQTLARIRFNRAHWGQIWARTLAVALLVCIGFDIGGYVYLMTLQPHLGRPDIFGPWSTLARVVQRYEVQLEQESHREPLVVGRGKYRLASELAFYRAKSELPESSSAFTTSQWIIGGVDGLGFSYWIDKDLWIGRDCVYVSDKSDIADVVRDRFQQVQLIDDPELRSQPGGLTYHIAVCRGFKP